MGTYTFKKIPGGATIQENGISQFGVHPNAIAHVDIIAVNCIKVLARGLSFIMYPDVDTIIIDETDTGGTLHTYGPGTSTPVELQKMIMNIFNPGSNYIMP